MDFFTCQDNARKNTKYLLILFLAVVCFFILLVNFIVSAVLWFSPETSSDNFFTWDSFGLSSSCVMLFVFGAVSYKWIQLKEGGRRVAENLGGRLVSPGTKDLKERQLLNVVEEMALASGMGVPPVYILEREKGINAFAAGIVPADGVIGVTRGALDLLNRKQMQGIIGHEFSHILNGDMKLNFRLICLLNGILCIAGLGKFLLHSSSGSSRSYRSSKNVNTDFRILLLGLSLVCVGWLGTFFSGFIKAAINRQREYLADASAVQFTRNPVGISNALKIIGGYSKGSRVLCAEANEASHMFIGNALGMLEIFTTHPSLEKRILRLEPDWDGKMIKQSRDTSSKTLKPRSKKTEDEENRKKQHLLKTFGGMLLLSELSSVVSFREVEFDFSEPLTCQAFICALLLDKQGVIHNKQMQMLQKHGSPGLADIVVKIVNRLDDGQQETLLPVINKLMPVLKMQSARQYNDFKRILITLIKADKKVELFEWCVYRLVLQYVGSQYGEEKRIKEKYASIEEVKSAFSLVLSSLIHHCHLERESADRAFVRGASTAGLYQAKLFEEEACSVQKFEVSVKELAACRPLLKARILKGLVNSVRFDGVVTPLEKELIITIASLMNSPVPGGFCK